MFNSIRLWLCVPLLAVLGACAEPASMPAMIAATTQVSDRAPPPSYERAITVTSVTGGKETNPMWTSQVGNAQFKEALEQSLLANRLAAPGTDGRFRLEATLLRLQQPWIGLDLTVTPTISYKLTDSSDNSVVYENTLVTPATASFGDSPIAIYRLKIANERAIRANITRLIEELYALPDRPARAGRST